MASQRTAETPGGVLVAIEGIDGVGKTTQIRRVAAALAARPGAPEVVTSKEPTDGPWGSRIRRSATEGRLSPDDELHAFVMDRRQHVDELIAPSLAAGRVVLLDRYYYSSAAYQGARGYDPAEVVATNEAFAPRPDVLVVLDLDPAVSLRRVGAREDGANLFEREEPLTRSRAIFLALPHPRKLVLDAAAPEGEITARVLAAVEDVIARKRG